MRAISVGVNYNVSSSVSCSVGAPVTSYKKSTTEVFALASS